MFAKYLYMQSLNWIFTSENTFWSFLRSLRSCSSINFLIIFHASREQRASKREIKIISIVAFLHHEMKFYSMANEHDEDQVGNVISKHRMQQFNLFSS